MGTNMAAEFDVAATLKVVGETSPLHLIKLPETLVDMAVRSGSSHYGALGDGHCYFRSIAAVLGMTHDEMRKTLLRYFYNSRSALVSYFNGYRLPREVDRPMLSAFKKELTARAEHHKGVDPDKSTDKWGGLDFEHKAMALSTGKDVVIFDVRSPGFATKYTSSSVPPGFIKLLEVKFMAPGAQGDLRFDPKRDIGLIYNGFNHYNAFI
jgi:hypothetical protein